MVGDELEAKREQLFASMMTTTLDAPNTTVEAREQFIRGFVALAIDAARGDFSTRDEYLETVIPAIKRSGMSLSTLVAGMSGVAMGGVLALQGDARSWWVSFIHDYGQALGAAWAAA